MVRCSAYGCQRTSEAGFRLRSLKKTPEREQAWKILFSENEEIQSSSYLYLCEIHFLGPDSPNDRSFVQTPPGKSKPAGSVEIIENSYVQSSPEFNKSSSSSASFEKKDLLNIIGIVSKLDVKSLPESPKEKNIMESLRSYKKPLITDENIQNSEDLIQTNVKIETLGKDNVDMLKEGQDDESDNELIELPLYTSEDVTDNWTLESHEISGAKDPTVSSEGLTIEKLSLPDSSATMLKASLENLKCDKSFTKSESGICKCEKHLNQDNKNDIYSAKNTIGHERKQKFKLSSLESHISFNIDKQEVFKENTVLTKSNHEKSKDSVSVSPSVHNEDVKKNFKRGKIEKVKFPKKTSKSKIIKISNTIFGSPARKKSLSKEVNSGTSIKEGTREEKTKKSRDSLKSKRTKLKRDAKPRKTEVPTKCPIKNVPISKDVCPKTNNTSAVETVDPTYKKFKSFNSISYIPQNISTDFQSANVTKDFQTEKLNFGSKSENLNDVNAQKIDISLTKAKPTKTSKKIELLKSEESKISTDTLKPEVPDFKSKNLNISKDVKAEKSEISLTKTEQTKTSKKIELLTSEESKMSTDTIKIGGIPDVQFFECESRTVAEKVTILDDVSFRGVTPVYEVAAQDKVEGNTVQLYFSEPSDTSDPVKAFHVVVPKFLSVKLNKEKNKIVGLGKVCPSNKTNESNSITTYTSAMSNNCNKDTAIQIKTPANKGLSKARTTSITTEVAEILMDMKNHPGKHPLTPRELSQNTRDADSQDSIEFILSEMMGSPETSEQTVDEINKSNKHFIDTTEEHLHKMLENQDGIKNEFKTQLQVVQFDNEFKIVLRNENEIEEKPESRIIAIRTTSKNPNENKLEVVRTGNDFNVILVNNESVKDKENKIEGRIMFTNPPQETSDTKLTHEGLSTLRVSTKVSSPKVVVENLVKLSPNFPHSPRKHNSHSDLHLVVEDVARKPKPGSRRSRARSQGPRRHRTAEDDLNNLDSFKTGTLLRTLSTDLGRAKSVGPTSSVSKPVRGRSAASKTRKADDSKDEEKNKIVSSTNSTRSRSLGRLKTEIVNDIGDTISSNVPISDEQLLLSLPEDDAKPNTSKRRRGRSLGSWKHILDKNVNTPDVLDADNSKQGVKSEDYIKNAEKSQRKAKASVESEKSIELPLIQLGDIILKTTTPKRPKSRQGLKTDEAANKPHSLDVSVGHQGVILSQNHITANVEEEKSIEMPLIQSGDKILKAITPKCPKSYQGCKTKEAVNKPNSLNVGRGHQDVILPQNHVTANVESEKSIEMPLIQSRDKILKTTTLKRPKSRQGRKTEEDANKPHSLDVGRANQDVILPQNHVTANVESEKSIEMPLIQSGDKILKTTTPKRPKSRQGRKTEEAANKPYSLDFDRGHQDVILPQNHVTANVESEKSIEMPLIQSGDNILKTTTPKRPKSRQRRKTDEAANKPHSLDVDRGHQDVILPQNHVTANVESEKSIDLSLIALEDKIVETPTPTRPKSRQGRLKLTSEYHSNDVIVLSSDDNEKSDKPGKSRKSPVRPTLKEKKQGPLNVESSSKRSLTPSRDKVVNAKASRPRSNIDSEKSNKPSPTLPNKPSPTSSGDQVAKAKSSPILGNRKLRYNFKSGQGPVIIDVGQLNKPPLISSGDQVSNCSSPLKNSRQDHTLTPEGIANPVVILHAENDNSDKSTRSAKSPSRSKPKETRPLNSESGKLNKLPLSKSEDNVLDSVARTPTKNRQGCSRLISESRENPVILLNSEEETSFTLNETKRCHHKAKRRTGSPPTSERKLRSCLRSTSEDRETSVTMPNDNPKTLIENKMSRISIELEVEELHKCKKSEELPSTAVKDNNINLTSPKNLRGRPRSISEGHENPVPIPKSKNDCSYTSFRNKKSPIYLKLKDDGPSGTLASPKSTRGRSTNRSESHIRRTRSMGPCIPSTETRKCSSKDSNGKDTKILESPKNRDYPLPEDVIAKLETLTVESSKTDELNEKPNESVGKLKGILKRRATVSSETLVDKEINSKSDDEEVERKKLRRDWSNDPKGSVSETIVIDKAVSKKRRASDGGRSTASELSMTDWFVDGLNSVHSEDVGIQDVSSPDVLINKEHFVAVRYKKPRKRKQRCSGPKNSQNNEGEIHDLSSMITPSDTTRRRRSRIPNDLTMSFYNTEDDQQIPDDDSCDESWEKRSKLEDEDDVKLKLRARNRLMRTQIKHLRDENLTLSTCNMRYKKKMQVARSRIQNLENRLEEVGNDKYYSLLRRYFNEDQIEAFEKTTGKIGWTDDTIFKALELRFACGNEGYEKLLKHIPLPSLMTLKRRATEVSNNMIRLFNKN